MSRLHRKQYDATTEGPLAGLRIVDLSRLVAGNMLTLQLADFGAEVIKIEPPAGDSLRNFRAEGYETWWKTYARNKLSVCIDLHRAAGIDVVKRLVATADALVESFRPGVLEAMGLGPDLLLKLNPKLVITRISGWGQSGPYSNKPGFGTLVEGYSGFASMNGFADREPVLPPMFLGDMTTGLYGSSATMMALWNVRVRNGVGQVIDLSLFEPTLSILGPQAANFKFTGTIKPRTGSRSSTTAPRNAYATSDGKWVCVSTSTETMAKRMFSAIGHEEVNADPRYSNARGRLQHVEEIDRIVGSFIGGKTLAENLAFFRAAEVTAGPVNDASQLMEDDYISERECLVDVEDQTLGEVPMHNITPRLSGTPGGFRVPAPRIGQHSRELLEPLLGDTAYRSLVAEGAVIQDPDRPQYTSDAATAGRTA